MSPALVLDNVARSLSAYGVEVAVYNLALGAVGVALLRARAPISPLGSLARAALWSVCAIALSALFAALTRNPFVAMNTLAFAVFLHAPALAIALCVKLSHRGARAGWALCALALAGIFVEAFAIEPTQLQVRRVTVRSAKLRRPLRAVVLADLQFDHLDEHTKRALRLAMDERPDVLLLPGDYVQQSRSRGGDEVRREANAFLRSIHFGAPLGVYAVEGNVEHQPGWESLFDGLRVESFSSMRRVDVGDELAVTGFGLHESGDRGLLVAAADDQRFHIAIGHAPDFALGDVRADLLVAGHTHGGQVQLPWVGPLVTFSSVPRAWAAGNSEVQLTGGRTLVVSRGVGMERGAAPRLRFRCRPEVVVIELRPAS